MEVAERGLGDSDSTFFINKTVNFLTSVGASISRLSVHQMHIVNIVVCY